MSVQHIVLAKFRNDEPEEAKEQVFEKLSQLLRGVPSIRDFHVGLPILPGGARGFDFGMTLRFENVDGFFEYVQHANHEKIIKYLQPIVKDSIAYPIESTPQSKL
ncbi:dabb-domain-containing protein [Obba rivulosa]|uniref:Dabb-domain-containing protein n=1 Tax=Obba rivulosa TaxID=1052685 RepID=A0A8E2AX35_9APHY|nr:dabb-domain-containing protein [Obba rivulosa]